MARPTPSTDLLLPEHLDPPLFDEDELVNLDRDNLDEVVGDPRLRSKVPPLDESWAEVS